MLIKILYYYFIYLIFLIFYLLFQLALITFRIIVVQVFLLLIL